MKKIVSRIIWVVLTELSNEKIRLRLSFHCARFRRLLEWRLIDCLVRNDFCSSCSSIFQNERNFYEHLLRLIHSKLPHNYFKLCKFKQFQGDHLPSTVMRKLMKRVIVARDGQEQAYVTDIDQQCSFFVGGRAYVLDHRQKTIEYFMILSHNFSDIFLNFWNLL